MLDDQIGNEGIRSSSSSIAQTDTSAGCFARRRSKSSSVSELSVSDVNGMTESTEHLAEYRRPSVPTLSHVSLNSLKLLETEENPAESVNDSPLHIDYKKLQEQNKELIKRNHKLSNTLDALRKERELLILERDKLKKRKKEEMKCSVLNETDYPIFASSIDDQHRLQTTKTSDTEINIGSKLAKDPTEDDTFKPGSTQHQSTLNKLLEEQAISLSLRNKNTELQLHLKSLENEIEKLHIQNSHNLLLVEQANAAAQVATNLMTTSNKNKKKSIFSGIRRSGRKKNSVESSPTKTQTDKNGLSISQQSLDGSLSEHDLASYQTRRGDVATMAYNPFNKPPDVQLLQTSIKLALEEKNELERQIACLRDEINAQQSRLMELMQENGHKERIYIDAVHELEKTRRNLQLVQKEKELLLSEKESMFLEIESLRAEKDLLKGKEVKAVLKEKQEMDFLRSENKALLSEVRTLMSNSDGLVTSLSLLKTENHAKDIRIHEKNLKLKKTEQELARMAMELTQIKNTMIEKEKEIETLKISRITEANKSSPENETRFNALENELPITAQIQHTPAISGYRHLHERAQSEDLTLLPPHSRSVVPMERTSSGGKKVVALQATLPTMETPVKSLSILTPSESKATGVNSIVKMFEVGKCSNVEEDPQSLNSDVKVTPESSSTYLEHKTPGRSNKEMRERSQSSTECRDAIVKADDNKIAHKSTILQKKSSNPNLKKSIESFSEPNTNLNRSQNNSQESNTSSGRKHSHGSSIEKSHISQSKDYVHRRTTSLTIPKETIDKSVDPKTLKDTPRKMVGKASPHHESNLNTISETKSTIESCPSAAKLVSKPTLPKVNDSTDTPETSEKSRTWPIKNQSELKTQSTANTLPSVNKSPAEKHTSVTPLNIMKPKPPPTANTKSSLQNSDSVLHSAGKVKDLRSSWESMSIAPSLKPLAKISSANTPNRSTNKPITKSDSGPPAMILSSPGLKKTSQSFLNNYGKMSTTPKISPSAQTPLTNSRTYSFTAQTTTSDTCSEANTSGTIKQNGISALSHVLSSEQTPSPRNTTSSSFDPSLRNPARKNSKRPASLYVQSANFESRHMVNSLISVLNEKTANSPPHIVTPSTHLPIKKQFHKLESSPNMTVSQTGPAFRIQRAASLSSSPQTKKAKLLRWCQLMTSDYENVHIKNFGESFSNGLAFCALLHHFVPNKIPYSTLSAQNRRQNFSLAFDVAEEYDIPRLLDINDMVEMEIPDWMSVMTYVSYIYKHFVSDASN